MKKYKLHKNFINEKEINDLSTWIDTNVGLFSDAGMGGNRLTTRYSFSDEIVFPKTAFDIQKKIIDKFNLKDSTFPHYKDGMVASCAYQGDTCYLHRDPRYEEGYKTVHYNILLSSIVGGEPFVLKNPNSEARKHIPVPEENINVDIGDMWTYDISEVFHGSKLLKTKERKMWVFGFHIKK